MRPILRIISAPVIFAFALEVGDANAACVGNQRSFAELSSDKRNTVLGPQNVEELESTHPVLINETGKTVPFGYVNKEWNELKAAILPGDRIFFVKHRDGSYGDTSYILVRNGCVINTLLISIS